MVKILVLKEHLREIYSQYDIYILAALKFLLTFLILAALGSNIGYMSILKNPLIMIGIGLLCSFMPVGIISLIMCASTLLHFSAVSMELTISTAIIMICMYCLYFILGMRNSLIMVLTVLLCFYQIPGAIVVALGLMFTPIASIPASFGIVLYTIIGIAKKDIGTIFSTNSSLDMLGKLSYLFQNIGNNEEMMLLIISFIMTISFVYVLRRMNINYSWSFAIGAGSVVYILIVLIGSFVIDIPVNAITVILSMLLGASASLILYLFVFSIDYTRVENVQFEDDDYYYFVKAIPKISVTTPEKKVKRINTRKVVHENQKNENE